MAGLNDGTSGLSLGTGLFRGNSGLWSGAPGLRNGGGGFSLDFTAGTLPSAATLTRASSGTRFNSSGTMVTETTNVARFDYDPISHAALGLLVEPAATNLLLRSAEIGNAAWSNNNVTFSSDSVVAPDGTTTADKVITDVVNNTHQVYQSPAGGSTPYVLSMFAKPAGYSWLKVDGYDGVTEHLANFDVTNGVVGTTASAVAALSAAGSGFYRCSVAYTAALNTSIFRVCSANNVDAFAGDGASGLALWGAQLEASAAATTYIPTTSASATRAADSLTVTVPAGYGHLTVTFDDNTTQSVVCVTGANVYTSASFNRTRIKTMVGTA